MKTVRKREKEISRCLFTSKSKDRVRLLLNLLNTSFVAETTMSNIENKEVVKNFKFY